MWRRLTWTVASIVGGCGLILPDVAQTQLLTVAPDPGSGKTLYEVSTATGSFAGSGPDIADCCAVLRGTSSIDEAGNRFFFFAASLSDSLKRIYTLDIPTGTVLGSPTVVDTNEYNFPEWAPVAGELLVVYRDTTDQSWYLAEVSPTTGALVDISSSPIADCCAGWFGGMSVLDEAAGRLYYVARRLSDSAWSLFGINTSTGGVASSPALSVDAFYQGLERDSAGGTIYLAYRDNALSTEHLATVHPTTGVMTNLGSGIANCCQIPLGAQSALDRDRGRFHLIARRDLESDDRIFSFDLASGGLVADPTLPATQDPDFLEWLPFLFADGFESGNTTAWSALAP